MKNLYFLLALLLLASCKKEAGIFDEYADATLPVKLGDGSLSTDSVQWNNVFVDQTKELYFTKMGSSVSIIHKMEYRDGVFHDLQAIPMPEGEPHSDIYLTEDGKVMLFSSLMQESNSDTITDWNIWKSVRVDGKWQEPQPFFDNNLEGNQFYPWLTKSGNLYFVITPHGSRNSDIYVCEYKDEAYQHPRPLPKHVNSTALEGDAFIASDESYMLFAGFERGQNLGKSDLYISYNIEGTWTAPVWLGEDINSTGYDGSPFVTSDGKFLIFTSSRGSTDDNTFFNHYIVRFNPEKYREPSLSLHNYLANIGNTPTRFAAEEITTSKIEYGGSLAFEERELYFTQASDDFSTRQIVRSTFKNGTFRKTERVSFNNTLFDDASDVQISKDGQWLYFKMRGLIPGDSSRKDGNIWRSKRNGNSWGKAELLPQEINSDLNEYYPVLTDSGNLYFSRETAESSYDIYVSQWVDGQYQEARPLPDHINTHLLESDAYVAPDESFMIFVRMYDEEGLGVSDLYISFNEAGEWSRPKNMMSINSSGVDGSPFVTHDGQYLFFTSTRESEDPEVFDGHLDIYVTQFNIKDWHDL